MVTNKVIYIQKICAWELFMSERFGQKIIVLLFASVLGSGAALTFREIGLVCLTNPLFKLPLVHSRNMSGSSYPYAYHVIIGNVCYLSTHKYPTDVYIRFQKCLSVPSVKVLYVIKQGISHGLKPRTLHYNVVCVINRTVVALSPKSCGYRATTVYVLCCTYPSRPYTISEDRKRVLGVRYWTKLSPLTCSWFCQFAVCQVCSSLFRFQCHSMVPWLSEMKI